MSPELGLVLLITLLWGPTALWLGARAFRGHQRHVFRSSADASEPTGALQESPPDALGALVDGDGFWVCGSCHSLNRREAKRCYGCHAGIGSEDVPVPRDPAARPPADRPPAGRPMVPVMAASAAGSVAVAPWSTVSPAPPEAPAQVASSGLPVCPYLGFRDDATTRCDFPDPRNLCHAAAARSAMSPASPRRFNVGQAASTRPQAIEPGLQASLCLSPAHERCERYPALQGVAAGR